MLKKGYEIFYVAWKESWAVQLEKSLQVPSSYWRRMSNKGKTSSYVVC